MSGRIAVTGLGRDYRDGKHVLTVLDAVDLTIEPHELVAITGPSGSGKSTLLGLMAGLDRPTRGRVEISGTVLTELGEDELSAFRGRHIGFVFQSFQLIPTLTALENVRVPAELLGDRQLAARAPALLERMGLSDRAHHYPSQLSGGEMQRVALARATVTRPAVLFADEPTGNLDSAAGERVLALLLEAQAESTLVLVTHNPELAARAEREIRMRHGRIERVIDRRRPAASERSSGSGVG
ncbi:MAG TPA: ABC transporter ATP-binding protein [Polyangiaceae bacterium]|nr:ABC transporter ATP-binding protein [Polyangiaceae bacterium]